jgi:hypothetical protein
MQGIVPLLVVSLSPKSVMRSPDMSMPCIENAKYDNPQAITVDAL